MKVTNTNNYKIPRFLYEEAGRKLKTLLKTKYGFVCAECIRGIMKVVV